MFIECRVERGNSEWSWSLDGRVRFASDEIVYRLGRPLVDLYARVMMRMDVLHHAPLPAGPKILAANHPSTTDPFLITLLAREPVSIVISESLFKVPLFGRYLHLAGHVPVVEGRGGETVEWAARLLEQGRTVAIFPEGAVSPLAGGFHQGHTGVARLALRTGAPVVPVGIDLQRERIKLVETGIDGKAEVGAWYLRGPYAVTVGTPLRFSGSVEDRRYVRTASQRVMQRIVGLAHESAARTASAPVRLAAPTLRSEQAPTAAVA